MLIPLAINITDRISYCHYSSIVCGGELNYDFAKGSVHEYLSQFMIRHDLSPTFTLLCGSPIPTYRYSSFFVNLDFSFNTRKSVALRIGPRFRHICAPLTLCNAELQYVDKTKYLDVELLAARSFRP